MNHIAHEYISEESELGNDEIRKKMVKLSQKDVIEQIIFDPHLGIVKREIHYGIIDYLTVRIIMIFIMFYRLTL